MKLSVSPALSQQSLKSHSWLGLLVGVLMYVVCLSGAIAVFAQEIMRWEQPEVFETHDYDPQIIQKAYDELLAVDEHAQAEEHIVIRLPTNDLPRASISTHESSWYINADGSLGPLKSQPFTDLIAELHAYLHLPESVGLLVVSILGALLAGLIVSGVFAHRRILKDAFSWRQEPSPKREADLHNRLSVWGLPFHLMIALTGAYFGLASYLTGIYADKLYDGDNMALFADIYGGIPEVENETPELNIPKALERLTTEVAPGTQPVFVTVEHVNEPDQFMLIGSQHMDRLIYAEQYRFDANGNYIDAVGYDGGEPGQAAIFSVYRTHFGHFGSNAIKLIYGLLGLALTAIAVSGINLWLQKRTYQDALNPLWSGFVWGVPLAFVLSALLRLSLLAPVLPIFWLSLVGALVYAGFIQHAKRVRRHLIWAIIMMIGLLLLIHVMRFGLFSFIGAAMWVNGGLILTALVLFVYQRRLSQRG